MPAEIDYDRYGLSGPDDLLKLAKGFMKISRRLGLTPDDALSACHEGLARALAEYMPGKGRFSTFAYWKMRGEVCMDSERLAFPMTMRRASVERGNSGVDSPAPRAMRHALAACSAQVRIDHYSEAGVADFRPGGDPEANAIEAEECDLAARMLGVLNERQRKIVERYLDLDGRGGATFKQIGVEIGVHRERARKAYLEALDRIRLNMGVAS